MSVEARLRPASPADLEALVAVWSAAARAAHPFLPGEGRGSRARDVRSHHLPRADTLLAEAAGVPVGFAAVAGAELAGLYVRPDWQGLGLGTRLLAAAQAGREPLTATVFLRSRAPRFYAARGFREIGRGIDVETGEPVLRLRSGSGI